MRICPTELLAMNFKSAVLASAILLSASSISAAAPTSETANQQIDNAINTHYASADLDKAEQALMAILESCGNSCDATVTSRAWMYIGIVRGSGRDDVSGAGTAFARAKALNPSVTLDELFATDLVKKVFEETRAAEQLPLMNDMRNRAVHEQPVSEILCSLTISEVETHRPIPISCKTPPADQVMLAYKHENSNRWHRVALQARGQQWIGTIPCSDTRELGVLAYRVESLDSTGAPVDELGSEADPLELNLVDQTDIEPPALPGQTPPESCRPKKKAPAAAGPKLGSYGDSCKDATQCQGGLTCDSGQCVADMSCDMDAECPSGACDNGMCAPLQSDCEGENCSSGRSSRNWFGIQGGIDFSRVSGTGVCGRSADSTFSCYDDGEYYRGYPNQNYSGEIASGFRQATSRIMLSYERGLGSYLALEGRVGFAFNGGPEAPSRAEDGDGSSFLPYHAEARLKVYFSGVFSDSGRGLLGSSFYAMAGGGLAQVDPQITVPVAECAPADRPDYPDISAAQNVCATSQSQSTELKQLKVVQRQGQGFVTAGLGFRYGFTRHVAALINLNTMVLLPSSGLTLSPSVGILAGF